MSKVLIGMDHSGSFRVYLAVTTNLVEEARTIHNTTPLATAGLGRVLTGAGMMGLLLKNKSDKLTLLFKGDGPAKQILATATGAGEVKGYRESGCGAAADRGRQARCRRFTGDR